MQLFGGQLPGPRLNPNDPLFTRTPAWPINVAVCNKGRGVEGTVDNRRIRRLRATGIRLRQICTPECNVSLSGRRKSPEAWFQPFMRHFAASRRSLYEYSWNFNALFDGDPHSRIRDGMASQPFRRSRRGRRPASFGTLTEHTGRASSSTTRSSNIKRNINERRRNDVDPQQSVLLSIRRAGFISLTVFVRVGNDGKEKVRASRFSEGRTYGIVTVVSFLYAIRVC